MVLTWRCALGDRCQESDVSALAASTREESCGVKCTADGAVTCTIWSWKSGGKGLVIPPEDE